jgi:hypothetical protein
MDPLPSPEPFTLPSKPNKHTKSIAEALKEIEQAVWQRRPILEDVVSKRSDKSLYEYAQGFVDINPVPGLEKRRPELIGVVEELLTRRVGVETAKGVARQLAKLPLVSTADHHGPINNPFFVNSNIISGIPYAAMNNEDIKYLIDFSFASISINNSSYPRGIEFNSDRGGIVKIPLFPDKLKMGVAYTMRAYTQEDLDRALLDIRQKEREGHITADRAELMCNYVQEYFGNPEVLEAENFASQITKLNLLMWPSLFAGSDGFNLIYLEIETIVTELLLKYHLHNSETFINRLLFNEAYKPLVLKYFNNIDGAFSLEEGWGSYLFWALDAKGRRVALELKGNNLVSKDGTHNYAFTPDGLSAALQDRTIFPGMLLCYIIVALYYGMKCLGGFSQVHDLTLTKDAWIGMLESLGEHQEAQAILPMQTKEYGGDGMLLAYLPSTEGKIIPAYGVEMAIGQAKQSFNKYVEYSKRATISETIAPMMPEIYNVLYNQDERDPELSSLQSSDIAKSIGLLDKLTCDLEISNPKM